MRRLFPIRRRHDRGAVIPMVALSLTVLMTMTAFAVDLGRMRTERRDLQAAADAIALDSVQAIRGLDAAAAQPVAEAEANASAARNRFDQFLSIQQVKVGHWDVPSQTFTQQTTSTEYPNAVEVLLTDSVKMFFDFSTDARSVTRRAVAVASGEARAEIGSVLSGVQAYDPLSLSECQVPLDTQLSLMNRIYSELLGIVVEAEGGVTIDTGPIDCGVTGPSDGLTLDIGAWRGLAFGRVDVGDVAGRIGAASADDLLDSRVSVADLLDLSAQSLQSSGNATDITAGTILAQIATHVAQDLEVELGRIFDGRVGTPSDGAADFTVNALDLLMASAMAIDGNNFAAVALPINLPFASTTVTPRISIVEPPRLDAWKRQGQDGPRTSQVRAAVDIPLSALNVDLAILGGLLAPQGTQPADGNLSIVVEAARADSHYDSITCSPEGKDAATVGLTVDTGAVTIGIGAISDTVLRSTDEIDWSADLDPLPLIDGKFGVSILGLGLVELDLQAITNIDLALNLLGATEPWTFTGPYATDFRRFHGGLSGTSISDQVRGAIDLDVQLSLLNLLGTTEVLVEQLVRTALKPVLDALQPQLLDPLLSALGVTVAGADARIWDVRCQVPALANRA